MLKPYLIEGRIEAGCDEAGRGCLAGPVTAAAVILPPDFSNELINDSKQLTERRRDQLREVIEREALAWAVEFVSPHEIDKINILNASITAMQRAVARLKVVPEHLLIDGNRFRPYPGIPHTTIIKGDATMLSIAAASILAKTHRDEYMCNLAKQFPAYGWDRNKGYPTKEHRAAIAAYGPTEHHRRSFQLLEQPSLFPEI
ncbi:MAG: ribonuclease HII [Bacteroidales bacterium]|nr:ribonuclease HII [Candidatus Sodaliphilus aphodohippi]